MIDSVSPILYDYSNFKTWLSQTYGLHEDLLHVHAGLIIFLSANLLLGINTGSRIPISVVYILAIANEVVDVSTPGKSAAQWEPLVDILNTVAWPTVLFAVRAKDRKYKSRVMQNYQSKDTANQD